MLGLLGKHVDSGIDQFITRLMAWKQGFPAHTATIEVYQDEYCGGWLVAILPHNSQLMDIHIDFLGRTERNPIGETYTLSLFFGTKGYQIPEGQTDFQRVLEVLDAVRNGRLEEAIWPRYSELRIVVGGRTIICRKSGLCFARTVYQFLGSKPTSVISHLPWAPLPALKEVTLGKDGKSGFRLIARF